MAWWHKPRMRSLLHDMRLAAGDLGRPRDDSSVYWLTSNAMPTMGQKPRLDEICGQEVTVTEKVFE